MALVVAVAYYFYSTQKTNEPVPGMGTPMEVTPAPEPITAPRPPDPSPEPSQSTPAPIPAPSQAAPALPAPPTPHSPAPTPKASTNAPGKLERLEGTFYLFGESIKDAGNGYRTAYTVLNSGVAAEDELAGQVKSQVFRVVMNCANSTWAYDQRYYFAMPFGEGKRLAERKWQRDEMKWRPLRDSIQDKKLHGFLCP